MVIIPAGLRRAGLRRARNYYIVFTYRNKSSWVSLLCTPFKSSLYYLSIPSSCCDLVNYLRACPVIATIMNKYLKKWTYKSIHRQEHERLLQKALVSINVPSALADHQVSRSPSLRAGRSRLAAHQVSCSQRSSLAANRATQVSPRQLHRAGLSPPIAPRRSLPANRAAQVSPRQ